MMFTRFLRGFHEIRKQLPQVTYSVTSSYMIDVVYLFLWCKFVIGIADIPC